MSTVLLAAQGETLLPIDRLMPASGPLSSRGDVLFAGTAVWLAQR